MNISSASSTAIQSIHRSLEGLQRNAAEIASADQLGGDRPAADTARSLVEARTHQRSVQAAAAVIRAEDQMTGALLDVFA